MPNNKPDHLEKLFDYAKHGHFILLKNQLDHDASVIDARSKVNGNTMLHHAVMYNQPEIIKLLIQYGATLDIKTDAKNVDYIETTPLLMAASLGNSVITNLLCAGIIKNILAEENSKSVHLEDDEEPLMVTGINAINNDGNTAAHIAAINNQPDIIRVLSLYKANFNIPNNEGLYPLHIAAQKNNCQCIINLIDGGANPNERLNSGETPAHSATIFNHIDALKTLILKDADISLMMFKESQEKRLVGGITPAHIAAENGADHILEVLAEAGFNLTKKTDFGKSALDVAEKFDQTDCIEYIKSDEARAATDKGAANLQRIHADYEASIALLYPSDDNSPSSAAASSASAAASLTTSSTTPPLSSSSSTSSGESKRRVSETEALKLLHRSGNSSWVLNTPKGWGRDSMTSSGEDDNHSHHHDHIDPSLSPKPRPRK